jgi:hypothetical protein
MRIALSACLFCFPLRFDAATAARQDRGIAFDELRRDAVSFASQRDERAVAAMRTTNIDGFEADHQWYTSHRPDENGEHRGPAGEDESLFRFAFSGHWIRFKAGITSQFAAAACVALSFALKPRMLAS